MVNGLCSSLFRTEVGYFKQSNRQLKYFCEKCNTNLTLTEVVNELKQIIEHLQQEVKELKSTSVRKNTDGLPSTEVIIAEIVEQERRANNIILFNIDECKSPDPQICSNNK